MERNQPIDAIGPVFDQDLIKPIVFHEAVHATAIYLCNKQKQLPPAYFQITIKKTITLSLIFLQAEQPGTVTLPLWMKVAA